MWYFVGAWFLRISLHGWKIFVHYYNRINIIRTHHLNLSHFNFHYIIIYGSLRERTWRKKTVCVNRTQCANVLNRGCCTICLFVVFWFSSSCPISNCAYKNRKGIAHEIKAYVFHLKSNDQFGLSSVENFILFSWFLNKDLFENFQIFCLLFRWFYIVQMIVGCSFFDAKRSRRNQRFVRWFTCSLNGDEVGFCFEFKFLILRIWYVFFLLLIPFLSLQSVCQ